VEAGSGLQADDIRRFHDDGFVYVRGAFAPEDARRMEDEWWSELMGSFGIRRGDRTTWWQMLGDLKGVKQSPLASRIASPRVGAVLDELLGAGEWEWPPDWGRPLVTFPEAGAWELPTGLWHWDSPAGWHRSRLNALFVVSFIARVEPGGGGTLLLAGSPRLLQRHEDSLSAEQLQSSAKRRRDMFHGSHPWLAALTGKAPSPADRKAAFMSGPTDIDGIDARVVELSGEPGDMVFCHPAIVHCIAPNRGDRPRFMRIRQQLTTHGGRGLLAGVAPAMS
jgi:hypothetical protein